MFRPSRQLAVLTMLMGFAAVASAEVYRWVDKDGRVHYSDRPVGNAEKVEIKAPPQAAPAPGSAGEDLAARAKACESKKKVLESYKKAAAIKETDAQGNDREYTPEERERLIQRTEKDVEAACGTSGG